MTVLGETPVIIFYERRSALLLSACQPFIRLVKFPSSIDIRNQTIILF